MTFINGDISAPNKYPGAFTISKSRPKLPATNQLKGNKKLSLILFFIGK